MASTKKKRTTTRAKKAPASPSKKVTKTEGPVLEATVEVAEATSRAPRVTDLFRWNKWIALIYALQALAILVAGAAYKLPILTQYPTANPLGESTATVTASRQLFDVDLVWLVAGFFIVSAVAHTAMAGMYRMRYEADIASKVNRLRWIDYAASGSIMMLSIALLSGVSDSAALFALAVLTAGAAFCYLASELYNRGKTETNWSMYILGSVAGVVPWLIVGATIISAQVNGNAGIPAFVYWIVGSMAVLSVGYLVHMYFHYIQKGKWADYLYVERVYMLLALVAKTVLAWQIFAGVLRP
jgi:hypothetical protein